MDARRREKITRLSWIYIDAYAGPGYHVSKTNRRGGRGQPADRLEHEPAFHEYHFIDTEPLERAVRNSRETGQDVYTYD